MLTCGCTDVVLSSGRGKLQKLVQVTVRLKRFMHNCSTKLCETAVLAHARVDAIVSRIHAVDDRWCKAGRVAVRLWKCMWTLRTLYFDWPAVSIACCIECDYSCSSFDRRTAIFCSQQKIVQTTQAIHAKLKRLNQNLIEIQFSLEMSHCKHEMLLILCWIGMASLPKPQMSS